MGEIQQVLSILPISFKILGLQASAITESYLNRGLKL